MKARLHLTVLFLSLCGLPAVAQSSEIKKIETSLQQNLQDSFLLRGLYERQSTFSSIYITDDRTVTITGK
jgi:hypothetical protein